MAAASSSSGQSFLGGSDQNVNNQQHSASSSAAAAAAASSSSAPPKRRRNLPDPNAEIIALSPRSLMATNRFICEVCNKGFQREQNLQLHRRGHNLPWKLRQNKANKDGQPVRKKVYLCPEPSCVHHDSARALGDLTGIKKHYSRKHGEKKFKCEKCSKKYAVQSDWKAHSKTCGTREYRCDCGTLFSRRDSFITHRAFCDALAQETARHPTSLTQMSNHLFSVGASSGINLGLTEPGPSQQLPMPGNHDQAIGTNILNLGRTSRFDQLLTPSSALASGFCHPPPPLQSPPSAASLGYFRIPNDPSNQQYNNTTPFNLGFFSSTASNQNNSNLAASAGSLFSGQFNNILQNSSVGDGSGSSIFPDLVLPSVLNSSSTMQQMSSGSPHMSATALLQKAAQMGSTASNLNPSASAMIHGFGLSSPEGNGAGPAAALAEEKQLQQAQLDIPAPMANIGNMFSGGENDQLNDQAGNSSQLQHLMSSLAGGGRSSSSSLGFGYIKASDRLTRDFLGVGEIVLQSMRDQQKQQQQHGSGIYVMGNAPLDPETTPTASTTQPFTGGNFQ
ncbi:indeterminate-domain 4, chloroplastic-like protein [Drosera capensis]